MDKQDNQQVEMTPDEREGVQMIQFLMSLDKETEPESASLENWRTMSPGDRQKTRMYYRVMTGQRNQG